jgi:hypothetical protein
MIEVIGVGEKREGSKFGRVRGFVVVIVVFV